MYNGECPEKTVILIILDNILITAVQNMVQSDEHSLKDNQKLFHLPIIHVIPKLRKITISSTS